MKLDYLNELLSELSKEEFIEIDGGLNLDVIAAWIGIGRETAGSYPVGGGGGGC